MIENPVRCVDLDFSKQFGLKRIGAHRVTLPSGCCTSLPHAESLEEEFVYVLSGNPYAWINGYLYRLGPGHAAGFPAGTGLAHSFINNSSEEVQLLVVGERTKKENLCSFPVNPEQKLRSPIWWENPPAQNLGPHNGLPGRINPSEMGQSLPPCIVFVPDLLKRSKSQSQAQFHYPGDNETFGIGVRLTDALGLKALGIWFEQLPPGRRSCYPHAHTFEEEFAYILDGTVTVWLDGHARKLKSGEPIAFIPGSGVSHCLINETSETISYIGIGEAEYLTGEAEVVTREADCATSENENLANEKIIYPLNPLRNKEFERKGSLWLNCPQHPRGPHPGTSSQPFPEHLRLRLCTTANSSEVFQILNASQDYFLKVEGCLPTLQSAESEILSTPKKCGENYFKEFLIIEYTNSKYENASIGVADLHCNHPVDGYAYVGLLLIRQELWGKGLGSKCYRLIEDYMKRALLCTSVRLGVSRENDVSGFWTSMGFKPNGRNYELPGQNKITTVTEYEKLV